MTTLRLLAWGHRRAVDPLRSAVAAFEASRPGVTIEIDVRPLSAFEHQGMAGAARACDMVVYDHPFSGDIAESMLFVPLDQALGDLLGPDQAARYIGPSLDSYRHGGRIWGAPMDGATQHALVRADLLQKVGAAVPVSWAQVEELGARLRRQGLYLALPVETPHTLMTVGALMANLGRPWSTNPHAPLAIDPVVLRRVLARIRAVLACSPADALAWNSIDVHDAMVARDDIVYCPCVYGYATYGEADMRQRLAFADFAGLAEPYHAGSVLGGTALGVSRHSANPALALEFARFMLQHEVQDKLVPLHHGQPATLAAWDDPDHDARFNGFYRAVRASMETAWIRPRLPGYPVFQREAGEVLASSLRGAMTEDAAVAAVLELADALNQRVFSHAAQRSES